MTEKIMQLRRMLVTGDGRMSFKLDPTVHPYEVYLGDKLHARFTNLECAADTAYRLGPSTRIVMGPAHYSWEVIKEMASRRIVWA